MQKSYRYRNIIFVMYYVLIGFAVLIAIITVAMFFLDQEAFLPFLFLDLVLGLEIWWYRRLKTTTIRVTAEVFEFVNSAKSIKIPYSDILALETKSIRFAGGWMKIITNRHKPIRIALNIKDGCELVKELTFKLSELELFDRYDEDKLYRYYQTAVYAEGSWKRLTLPSVLLLVAGSVLVYFDLFIGLIEANLNHALFLLPLFVIGLGPYYYLEFGTYAKHIKNQPWTPDWTIDSGDLATQKKHVLFAMIFYVAIALGVLLYLVR